MPGLENKLVYPMKNFNELVMSIVKKFFPNTSLSTIGSYDISFIKLEMSTFLCINNKTNLILNSHLGGHI